MSTPFDVTIFDFGMCVVEHLMTLKMDLVVFQLATAAASIQTKC